MASHAISLNGKSVIITGGASGIGLAVVDRLAATGAYITIIDKDDCGEEVASRWTASAQHVQFVKCDVTDWVAQCAAFKKAVHFSPAQTVDTVIVVAGLTDGPAGRMIESTLNLELDTTSEIPITPPPISAISVNLIGTYYSAWLACRFFRLNADVGLVEKSLILIASSVAYASTENSSTSYWASKWGVRGIFQSIKNDMKRVSARCNLIAPHFVKTKLLDAYDVAPAAFAEMGSVVDIIERCATDTTVNGLKY